MIEWCKDIITDDIMSGCSDDIICDIINKKILHNTFCIALASNDKNLLDIINANEFRFSHYDRITTKVIGLCKGKENAVTIVTELVKDVYKKTGSYNIKDYYKNKEFRR